MKNHGAYLYSEIIGYLITNNLLITTQLVKFYLGLASDVDLQGGSRFCITVSYSLLLNKLIMLNINSTVLRLI